METLKLFLSEATRHRALIIDMKHHLVNVFHVCSYYGQFQTQVSDRVPLGPLGYCGYHNSILIGTDTCNIKSLINLPRAFNRVAVKYSSTTTESENTAPSDGAHAYATPCTQVKLWKINVPHKTPPNIQMSDLIAASVTSGKTFTSVFSLMWVLEI